MTRSSSRRAPRTSIALLAGVAAALSVLGAPPPASAGPPHGEPRIEILAPESGAVIVARNESDAANTRVTVSMRLHGPITGVDVELNGHPVRFVQRGQGVQKLTLDPQSGLTVGQNLLWINATVRDGTRPVQMAHRFVVGYRVNDLLTSSGIRLGAGDAPAAALTVEAPLSGVNQTTAALNGKAIALPGARTLEEGRRSLDLNLGQLGDVGNGNNTFDLRIVMNDGRVQDLHHSFKPDNKRNVAVARLTGDPQVGRALTLDASSSRNARGGKIDARWTLLRQPEGSHARLGAAAGMTSILQPDVPGTYDIELRTGTGSAAGYDLLSVAVSPAEALVAIDTEATQNGTAGLQVGDQFYAYDSQPIQVTVLNRYTLEMKYHYGQPATPESYSEDANDWSSLDSTSLVIVSARDGAALSAGGSLDDLDDALQTIGGNLGAQWRFENSYCWSGYTAVCTDYWGTEYDNTWTKVSLSSGPFTVIGVPGMDAGQAWRATADQTKFGANGTVGTGSGRFTGYLTLGVVASSGLTNLYTVVGGPDAYVPVDTCADVAGDTCAVTVGDSTYSAPAGANGFHVVVLDRTTLAVQRNQVVETFDDLQTAINASHSGVPPSGHPVGHYLTDGGQGDQSLVIIRSVGSGVLSGTPSGGPWASYLWRDLTQLGGTPEALSASADGSHPYALVGVADNLPFFGSAAMESSTVMANPADAPGQPSGRISGVVQRDRTGLYTPSNGSPAGPINTEFYTVLYQPAQDWPYADDPALPYIANGIGLGGYPDVRSAYTNLSIDFASKEGLLTNLVCSGQSFCGADFDAVKAQLLQEFDWVQTVRAFIANLLSPYTQNGSGSIFAVDAIYDQIYNSLPPPPPAHTGLNWLSIVTDVIGIASVVASVGGEEEASQALSLAGSGIGLAGDFMQSNDGGTADTVESDAPDDLSAQLAEQQTAVVEGIDRMETILLTDYGRLSTVGSKAGGGDPSWAWTSETTIDAIDALNASTRSASYSTLIPQIYKVTDLEPGTDDDPPPATNYYTSDDPTTYLCHDEDRPFYHSLPQNQFVAVTRNDLYNAEGRVLSDAWLFANDVSSGSPKMPTTSLTDAIYGPTSRGSEGAFQYEPAWWRSTFNPPGGIMCYITLYPSHAWDAPDIPLPTP